LQPPADAGDRMLLPWPIGHARGVSLVPVAILAAGERKAWRPDDAVPTRVPLPRTAMTARTRRRCRQSPRVA